MTFEIDVNGRTRTVAIERTRAGRYRVSLDGAPPTELDAARVGAYGLSLLDAATGRSRDVQVAPGSARGELLVSLGGRTVVAAVNGRRSGRAGADGAGAAHGRSSPSPRRCRAASSACSSPPVTRWPRGRGSSSSRR